VKKYLRLLALLAILGLFVMGQYDCAEANLQSKSFTQTLIDETATVHAGQHRDYPLYVGKYQGEDPIYLKAGGKLDISLTATQDVSFYLCDEKNYLKFLNYQPPYYSVINISDIFSFSHTYNVPVSGSYHFIINNGHDFLNSSVTIKVLYTPPLPTTTVIWDEITTVPVGRLRYYSAYLEAGDKLSMFLGATEDIDVYLFDETNYQWWVDNLDNTPYIEAHDVSSFSQTFNIPTSQKYYFVIDNTYNFSSSSVTIKVLYTR